MALTSLVQASNASSCGNFFLRSWASRKNIVPCIKVAAQDALEIFPDQAFDYGSCAGGMVLIVAYRRRAHTPDIAILAIFSPARLIGLHGGAGTDREFEIIQDGLAMLPDPVEHLHNLSNAHLKAVQGVQQLSELPNGQTHHRAQRGDQTGQSYSNTSLPKHFCTQLYWCFVPFLAPGAPAFENLMVGHLDRGWEWHIDHLAHPR